MSGQLHAPAALARRKSPRYPLDRRLGGPQSRSGRHGPYRDSNSDLSIVQPVGSRYKDCDIPAPIKLQVKIFHGGGDSYCLLGYDPV
jgi:hypothetical protein